ncbi:YadA family autotransporter adhesin [Paraburkholderia sp.]|jgi:autotransporter adhesin|uniref:YadA family autotransporter adhesin n=1 Tax=Paraburkholderia sp. TaxID=1926495 RepID=UPI002F4174B3
MRRKAVAQAVRSTLSVALAATALHVANVRAALDPADLDAANALGNGAIALGEQAGAAGDASLAAGWQANAQSDGATAVGAAASAEGQAALALGRDAIAQGDGASAVGSGANAQAERASAFGLSAAALGVDSIAAGSGSMAAENAASTFGALSSATGIGATAVGYNAQASAARSLATGAWATASADWGVALGSEANVSGIGGIALGVTAEATGTRASAIGFGATATGANAVALGPGANAAAENSVALGANSSTTADLSQTAFAPAGNGATSIAAAVPIGEVSLGSGTSERRLTHVAAGAAPTDAVNVSQLSAVDGKVDEIAQSSALHYFKADDPIDGSNAAVASGTHTLAAGSHSSATGANATAFGAGSNANGTGSTALGADAVATAMDATSIGTSAAASGDDATAVGAYATASGDGSIALGYGANAAARNALSLGYNASALAVDSVALGNGSIADRIGTVSVGSIGNERQITNVAAGSADTDAVNVAQLKAVGNQSAATAARLDAAVIYDTNADGSINRNSVTFGGDPAGGTVLHNVANGVEATDAVNVAQLQAVSDQSAAMATKLDAAVMYDTNEDGSIDRNGVTLGGDPATGTVLHNVANGVEATDAVNVGQLTAALDGAISNVMGNSISPSFSADVDRDSEVAVSSGVHAVAAGANAQATGANATAIGADAVASGNNATALGAAANAGADNSVALGQGSLADRANTVSVGTAAQQRQITHVAAGVQGTDAVNVNQLRQSVGAAVDQANRYTDDQIRSARRDGYGGTATALAMAGLPQAVLPGRGMIAMAGGTYAGQSALALGVSQLSDTGSWVYKVQGSADSRGQFGASVGAGVHW